MVPDSSLELARGVLVSILYSLISYLLGRPFSGHRLSIGRVTPCTARNVRFEATLFDKTYHCSFVTPSITWSLHFPRRVDPRWCTITVYDIFYKSSTGDVSIGRFELILWFFPVFFRQTTQPWGNVVIDDFRVLVFKSTQTPYYIHRLREKLISALLTGDVMRCDLLRTTCRFSGLSDATEEEPWWNKKGGNSPEMRWLERPQDEARRTLGVVEPEDVADGDQMDPVHEEDVAGSEDEYQVREGDEAGAKAKELASEGEYTTVPMRAHNKDEVCFCWLSRQLHIHHSDR